jgi:hypothetical protein
MAPISRWRRAIRIAAVSILVLVAALALFVSIQQRILRWRAERLLADVRAVQMGKSTWKDAQSLMYRWGKWGHYDGSCTGQQCNYQIEIRDSFSLLADQGNEAVWSALYHWRWTEWTYEFLGGRPVWVVARFEVSKGLIWAKDYVLWLEAKDKDTHGGWDYILFGSAKTVWRTTEFRHFPSPEHPEYVVGRPGGCEGCETVYARYTPFANPSDVNRLLDFNLDCITRRNPCQHPIDVMSTAGKENLAQEAAFEAADEEGRRCLVEQCTSSPEFLGRDKENVVIAQVVSANEVQDDPEYRIRVLFKLKQRLKRAEFWNSVDMKEGALPIDMTVQKGEGTQVEISPGREVILTLNSRNIVYPDGRVDRYIDLEPCDVIPLTVDNLAAVRRGISRDIFPAERNVWP